MPPCQGDAELSFTCDACGATGKALLTCARCKRGMYCNKTCQKADWAIHKLPCKLYTQIRAAYPKPEDYGRMLADVGAHFETNEARARLLDETPTGDCIKLKNKPFTALQDGTFLHDLPIVETFKLLIDCQRLLQEDIHDTMHLPLPGTIYAGEATSNARFSDLMTKLEQARILPSWMGVEHMLECICYAAKNEKFSLGVKQTEQDIRTVWQDDAMPFKLRTLAFKAYDWMLDPEGQDLLEEMVKMESSFAAARAMAV